MKRDIILYSVPQIHKATGGPRTRVLQISEVLKSNYNAKVISGTYFQKFKKSFLAKKTKVLYIESRTNRITIYDLLCIMLLKFKTEKTITYIRDIYMEIFPHEYYSLRGKLTHTANKLTNHFFSLISDKLCFPTIEMGKAYYQHNPKSPQKPFFDFPPGTYIPKITIDNYEINKRINKISFIYLGGTKYKHSGFETYCQIAQKLGNKFDFYVITNDKLNTPLLKEIKYKFNLKHSQVIEFIKNNNITFAIHTRPYNEYDAITFPIKILDFISCQLPVISLPHTPLKKILPINYTYYQY